MTFTFFERLHTFSRTLWRTDRAVELPCANDTVLQLPAKAICSGTVEKPSNWS